MNKPVILTSKNTADGAKYLNTFKFTHGPEVPVYDITSLSAFNQVIGHAKFINRAYGRVLYRGITKLYDNVRPSVFRNRKSGEAKDLRTVINSIYKDKQFLSSLKINPASYSAPYNNDGEINSINRNNKYIIEALLQHYSGNTSFIDVVDNHWVALWMGLYECQHMGRGKRYSRYIKRIIPVHDFVEGSTSEHKSSRKLAEDNMYLYVLLIAVPDTDEKYACGVQESDDLVVVDLRKSLPSIFLRPHAQHALVVRKRQAPRAEDYDLASQVVGVIRVRIDYASQWLGDGTILTQDNLFPPPAFDQGYDNLLRNPLMFKHPFEIITYF